MKTGKITLRLFVATCALTLSAGIAYSQAKAVAATVQVHMVITNDAQRGSEVPTLQPGDVKVGLGKNPAKVTQLIAARGENAALQLIILIDDTLDPSIGTNLNDLRDFINAQPETAAISIAYMSNTTIQVAQNFTNDHALAAKALRLPRGGMSAVDSPYLSLISLVKGWPEQKVRREVLMVTDGIDRLRGQAPTRAQLGRSFGPVYHSMPTMSPDVDSASSLSQRSGAIIHTLYASGVGRAARSSWDQQIGLSGLTKLAEETGGECFSLGTSNAVSFKPYLERLKVILDNQYYLVFQASRGKKSELRRVILTTEVPNSEIAAADNVWVPVGVWTNDDVAALRGTGAVSTATAEAPPAKGGAEGGAQAQAAGAEKEKPLPPEKDPKHYRAILAPLRKQLADVEAKLKEVQNALNNPLKGGSNAVNLDARTPEMRPKDQVAALEKKRQQLQAQIDNLETQARKNGLNPGDIR